MARVVVSSRFSMWMAWGPELTFFCNDAYRRDTLGKKYPWALGRPAWEVWAEIWDDIGPRIEAVMRTGVATWEESLLLFLERSGYVEETYHTFSYSPLTDDLGAIAGMLCVVSEDTERVVGERRMATLRELGSESSVGRDDREYLRAASRPSGGQQPVAAVHARLPVRRRADAGASSSARPGSLPGIPPRRRASTPGPEIRGGRRGQGRGDRRAHRPPVRRRCRPGRGASHRRRPSCCRCPTRRPSRPYGFLVVGVNRYRPLDAGVPVVSRPHRGAAGIGHLERTGL